MNSLLPAPEWPPLETLARLIMALGVGLFVGLEREWSNKEAGLRTFGFCALFCGIGGLLGPDYGLVCIALLGVLVTILNWQSLKINHRAELTTSASLLVTGLAGILCGMGHAIIPAAVTVITAGLLAWKENLSNFSHKLSLQELRSAILLAILSFAIYPILPNHPMDRWGFLVPREAWMTVVLIAGIGFVNYVLWKAFGESGMELTGFLGGLVNSTVAVAELANRAKEVGQQLIEVTYRGVLLATAAMALRNAVLLGILAPPALAASVLPLVLLLIPCALLVLRSKQTCEMPAKKGYALPLSSPFSLASALKFGAIFLVLQFVGTLAQKGVGTAGFYAVSLAGGLVSSASSVASAGLLFVHGTVSAHDAGVGAVLASLASAGVNIALVVRVSKLRTLNVRLTRALGLVIVLAIVGAVIQARIHAF